jgi:hypothetical protein
VQQDSWVAGQFENGPLENDKRTALTSFLMTFIGSKLRAATVEPL